ncbi:hypothetical protein BLOT_006628, partial [Blomia tropicalis]
MDKVNEFKKLLQLNLEDIQFKLDQNTSLKSINKKSSKLNHLLGNNILGTQLNIPPVNDIVYTDLELKPINQIGQDNVQSFEELLKIKLQSNQISDRKPRQGPIEKKPFLKKGDGLKRFNIKPKEINIISRNDKPKSSKNSTKQIGKKPFNEPGLQLNEEDCRNYSKKIIPIMIKTPSIQGSSNLKNETKVKKIFDSSIENDPKRNFEPRIDQIKMVSNSNVNSNKILEDYNKINNSNIKYVDLYDTSSDEEDYYLDPKDTLRSIRIVQQIEQLEKRVLDLLTLKGSLTQEQVDENDEEISINKKDSQISSFETAIEKISNLVDNVIKHNSNDCKSSIEAKNGQIELPNENGAIKLHSGQLQILQPDGTKRIIYEDGQQRVIKPNNEEQIFLTDGRISTIFANGIEKIDYDNGDVEYKTNDYT